MIASTDPTLSDYLEQFYLRKPKMATASAATIEDYRYQVRHLRRWFGQSLVDQGHEPREPRLSDLSEHLIEGAMTWQLRRGRSAPTANKIGRVGRLLWRDARRTQRRTQPGLQVPHEDPLLEFLPEPERIPEAWWIEEFEEMLKAAAVEPGWVGAVEARKWWPALLRTDYNTGARISEVMAIRTDWVDWRHDTLTISHEVKKDRADQVVTLLPETSLALRELRAEGRLDELFEDWPYDRNALPWPALNRGLRRIQRRAGLPIDREDLWHKIRRTFATYVAAAAGEVVAQQLLGHSSIYVTRRYIDPRKLNQPSAKDLLPRVLPNQPRLLVTAE